MKSLIRNNRGFTLAELVIAGGIAGVIGLVAVTSLKHTRQASNIVVVASEASTLKSLIVAQLINPLGCRKTFPPGTAIARSDVQILSSGGAVVAKKGLAFGPTREFSITDIVTSSVSGSNILKIKVGYDLKASLDKAGKIGAGKRKYEFDVDLFVNKSDDGLSITGCFIDIAGAARKAIKLSCQGGGATHDEAAGLYGTCTHSLPEIRNDAGVKVTDLCPTGQYLKKVEIETTGTPPKNNVILQCQPLKIGPCGPWSYVNKIGGSDGGPADCVSLSTYFKPGEVLATVSIEPLTYMAIKIDCGVDQVLRKIKNDGKQDCIPKHIETLCGNNQYVYEIERRGDGTFEGKCKNFENLTGACPSGKFLQTVNSDGSYPTGGCVDQALPASCPVGQVMTGLYPNGTAKCVPN